MKIDEKKRKALMDDFRKSTKVVVESSPSQLFELMLDGDVPTNRKRWVHPNVNLLFFGARIELKANKNEDKAVIDMKRYRISDELVLGFADDGHPERVRKNIYTLMSQPEMRRLFKRVELIAGMALCAIVPVSNVSGYRDRQTARDRYFKFGHVELNALVTKHTALTGNFKEDYQKALRILWFYYPYDLTGHDEKIKYDSLRLYHVIEKEMALKVKH